VTPPANDLDEARRRARVNTAALALSILIAAVAIVVLLGWSTAIVAVFGVAVTVIARPRIRRGEVFAMAVAIGASATLAGVGLSMVSLSQFAESLACRPVACPEVGPTLRLTGAGALIAAAAGAARFVWFVRQRDLSRLLLPALKVLLLGLFFIALVFGERWGDALVEFAGLTAATGILRYAPARPRLLRAAVFAQAADLGTFGFVWQSGLGEQNPLGRWAMEALVALGPADATWEATAAAGLVLILAKLALIRFLIWVTPHLGRYRRVVLVAGTVVGCIGAATNVLVKLP